MPTMIFVNLPVRDAAASRAFWNGLGYATDERFTDERTTNAQISDTIFLMLLERSRFEEFLAGPIGDPTAATSALLCLSADSREAVDALVDRALAGGATDWRPAQDMGAMYGRSFRDPDGHVWEVMWMDVAAFTGQAPDQELAGASS